VHAGRSLWNHIGLHNPGVSGWIQDYYTPHVIVSIAGSDDDIQLICNVLRGCNLGGIELNFSCPNTVMFGNKKIPKTEHKLQLKLNYLQDPYKFDLNNISRISLNSVPKFGGGVSGKIAQKYNWPFIKKFINEGLPIAGCSVTNKEDILKLSDFGCYEIALGSVMLINPWLVQSLNKIGEL
jgi:dihydroorotate dehydrogenase